MAKSQTKRLVIVISVIVFLALMVYFFGVKQTQFEAGIDIISMKLVSEDDNFATYQLSWAYSEPTRESGPGLYDFQINYNSYNTKTGDKEFPKYVEDINNGVYYPATSVQLSGLKAIFNPNTGVIQGATATYEDAGTECEIVPAGSFDNIPRAGVNCHIKIMTDILNKESARYGSAIYGITSGSATVKIPKKAYLETLSQQQQEELTQTDEEKQQSQPVDTELPASPDNSDTASGVSRVVDAGPNTVVIFSYVAYAIVAILVGYIIYISFIKKKKKGKKKK